MIRSLGLWTAAAALFLGTPAFAQDAHQHSTMPGGSRWMLMQDGAIWGIANHQGGPTGDTEFVAPSWWMGMASKDVGTNRITLTAMFSPDILLVGKSGYHELFQEGESLNGVPIVNRQHPHDVLMQLAAAWRTAIGSSATLTIAGALAGEPTIGPVAFMHRPSAAGLAFAPITHHTFDSTHVSFGVISAGIDRGRWTVEASVFNGREPDDNRWDVDLGRMDSVAGRVWFRPTPEWTFQVSTAYLRDAEEWEQGVDVRRTTVSGSWTRAASSGFTAVTAGWGMNSAHRTTRQGAFAEVTTERGPYSVFGRLDLQQLELIKFIGVQGPVLPGEVDPHAAVKSVVALTIGGGRGVATWHGFEGAVLAQVGLYLVPPVLRPAYGSFPVSGQLLLRIRLPTGAMGRMWNHRMGG